MAVYEPFITSNPNLWVGQILKTARVRMKLIPSQLDEPLGLKGDGRMVRLWESDKREIGGHTTSLEKVMEVYKLTDEEKREVIRRVSLRKHEVVSKKLGITEDSHLFDPTPSELIVLNQLMTLPREKREWVVKSAQDLDKSKPRT